MSLKEASRYESETIRNFAWSGYVPFFSMFVLEAAFLFLSWNLGTPWGMGTAGALAARIAGAGSTHYPGFFIVLPVIFSYVDVGVYTVLGAVLIPLALTRILPIGRAASGTPSAAARIRGAVLPTFITFALVLGLLVLWEMAIPRVVAPVVRMIPRIGILAPAVTWLIGTLVGLVFSALTLYVPIVAVREGGGLSAIGRGVGDGWRLFGTTYLVLATFSALPLVITAFIQTSGSTLVARLRPEVMPWMLLTYALLMSVANYLVYSAGARMHEAAVKEEE